MSALPCPAEAVHPERAPKRVRFVPPWDIEEHWDHWLKLLEPAMDNQTALDGPTTLDLLKRGKMSLWDAGDAALVTCIEDMPLERVCIIVLCGGSHLSAWTDDAWNALCHYARFCGCGAMTAYGRTGWARARPEMKIVSTVMRAAL